MWLNFKVNKDLKLLYLPSLYIKMSICHVSELVLAYFEITFYNLDNIFFKEFNLHTYILEHSQVY